MEPFAAAAALTIPHRPLGCARSLTLLGLSIRLEAENMLLLDAASAVVGGTTTSAAASADSATAAVRVVLRAVDPGAVPLLGADLTHAWSGPAVLHFAGCGCVARVDLGARLAVASLAPALLRDEVRLRDVVHALALSVLTRQDRQPLHAAALAGRAGGGLLLAAPSGTGKSTLGYAAARAGLLVLADDTVFVQLEPESRVWPLPGPLHLPESAVRQYPALRRAPLRQRANGKWKRVVPIAGAPAAPLERTALCVVRRTPGTRTPALVRISVETAVAEIAGSLSPGFDAFRETLAPCVEAAASAGAYRLDLTTAAGAGMPLLRSLLDTV